MDVCETHAWTSIGVTHVEGDVVRIWVCENCPTWTEELLPADREVPWDDTRLSEL
ncbi:MAG: hypothetical protein ABEI96_11490 [Haloarculaceae archaeon]